MILMKISVCEGKRRKQEQAEEETEVGRPRLTQWRVLELQLASRMVCVRLNWLSSVAGCGLS